MAGLVAYLAIVAAFLAIFTSAHPAILSERYHTPGSVGRSANGVHERPSCSLDHERSDHEAVPSIAAPRHHDEAHGNAKMSLKSTFQSEQSLLALSNVHVTEMLEVGDTQFQRSFRRERRDLASDGHHDSRNGTVDFDMSVSSGLSEEAKESSWSQLSGIEKLLVGGGLIIWNGTGLGVFLKGMAN